MTSEATPSAYKSPKISVIVTIYQMESYLKECVDSILSQTLHDIQVILVDDGSTDSGGIICDEYQMSDARVKVLHQANQGVVASRKTGLNLADAEYVLFVDADDRMEPSHLECIWEIIQTYHCDIVSTSYSIFSEDGRTEEMNNSVLHGYYDSERMAECQSVIFDNLPRGNIGITYLWQKTVRKKLMAEVLHSIPNWLRNTEGILASIYLLSKCNSLFFADEIHSIHYRERVDSMSTHLGPDIELQYSYYINALEDMPLCESAARIRDQHMKQLAYNRIERMIRNAASHGIYSSYQETKQLGRTLHKDPIMQKYLSLEASELQSTSHYKEYIIIAKQQYFRVLIMKLLQRFT